MKTICQSWLEFERTNLTGANALVREMCRGAFYAGATTLIVGLSELTASGDPVVLQSGIRAVLRELKDMAREFETAAIPPVVVPTRKTH